MFRGTGRMGYRHYHIEGEEIVGVGERLITCNPFKSYYQSKKVGAGSPHFDFADVRSDEDALGFVNRYGFLGINYLRWLDKDIIKYLDEQNLSPPGDVIQMFKESLERLHKILERERIDELLKEAEKFRFLLNLWRVLKEGEHFDRILELAQDYQGRYGQLLLEIPEGDMQLCRDLVLYPAINKIIEHAHPQLIERNGEPWQEWGSPALLVDLYIMLFTDITEGRVHRICKLKTCGKFFSTIRAETSQRKLYCCEGHARAGAQEQYRKRKANKQ